MMTIKNTYLSAGKNLPAGVFSLFFIQVFSTLSFSVLYSTLVLYMMDQLQIPAHLATTIMGVFVAFNFVLHLLGGYWGGRLFSNRALFCIGMLAQIVGCIILASTQWRYFYYGLAVFLTGSGLNVTCLNCMLTQRFAPNDNRRENAFFYNYAGVNLGFFIGFSLSGYFQLLHNYHRLFLLSALGNLVALFICLYHWHALGDKNTPYSRLIKSKQQKVYCWGMLMVVLLIMLLGLLLPFVHFANQLVVCLGVLSLLLICCWVYQQQTLKAKKNMLMFALFFMVSVFFWTLFQLGPMGLIHFIANNVDRRWGSMLIPPQWFQNINTFGILLGAPLLSAYYNRMHQLGKMTNFSLQFAVALLLIGIAFMLIPFGILYANPDGLVEPFWIMLSLAIQSIGELLISPVGYAMVGTIAPQRLQGIMMGMWMLSTGIGASLASYSSNWMTVNYNSTKPLVTNPGYYEGFLWLGFCAFICGLLFIAALAFIQRTTRWRHIIKEWHNVI